MGKLIKRIILVIVLLLVISVISFVGAFNYYIKTPVDKSSKEEISFVVENGMGKNAIADKLESEGIIKNSFFFKLYLKSKNTKDFLAGDHKLSKSMTVDEIIDALTKGDTIKIETTKITFVEGKKFPYYVKKISETFVDISEESVYNLTNSAEFQDKIIEKYWFIDESIKNSELYYPLEGYIFPDTYEFKKDVTAEEIILKMLDQMGEKLSAHRSQIESGKYSVHELLTMASLVELEGVTPPDRKVLAGVFYNRLEIGWTLGSDVTTYYAARKELTEPIYQSELNACNAYNTRGTCVKGLPVGPICSPSYSSIVGAIEPTKTEYLYFVADKNRNLYFGVTNGDHHKNINDLKKQGLWPE